MGGSTESGVERGAEYFKILRRRVMEMNARVISKYYKRIRLERMSVLLAVGRDEWARKDFIRYGQ